MKFILPTKTYLRKFIGCYVQLDPAYSACRKDVFGAYLYNLLNDRFGISSKHVSGLNDKIIIEIPVSWTSRGKLALLDKEVTLFNDFAELLFYQQFYQFMDVMVSMGKRQDRSRAWFCELYGIEIDSDINDETLKKRYDRFCLNRSTYHNPFRISDGKPRPIYLMKTP